MAVAYCCYGIYATTAATTPTSRKLGIFLTGYFYILSTLQEEYIVLHFPKKIILNIGNEVFNLFEL